MRVLRVSTSGDVMLMCYMLALGVLIGTGLAPYIAMLGSRRPSGRRATRARCVRLAISLFALGGTVPFEQLLPCMC